MRRILERLVYKAKEAAADVIDNEMFEQAKVAEKLRCWKDIFQIYWSKIQLFMES